MNTKPTRTPVPPGTADPTVDTGRRQLLAWSAALAPLALTGRPAGAADPAADTLREIARQQFDDRRVFIGVAAHGAAVEKDEALRRIVSREFGYVTPANDFKQSLVHPQLGAPWNWALADRWVQRAMQDNQILRLHAPVGPQVSTWAKDDARTPGELNEALDEWIPALCKRYAKQPVVRWMDVVNETIEIDGRWSGPRPGDRLPENPWLALGMSRGPTDLPTYIVRAFELANEHAGDVKLIVNQHHINPPASARLKSLVLALRARGLRVDGIGWQAHVEVGWEQRRGRLAWMTDLIDWAHANALEFHITENNVYIPRGQRALDAQAQATTFGVIVKALLERRQRGVVAWNLWHARDDQTDNAQRLGCLWDNQNRPKPAYETVRNLLAQPPRPLA